MEAERTRSDGIGQARTLPIHRSLARPVFLAGADRELVLANGVVVTALLFGIGLSWYTVGISAALLIVGHWGLVLLSKYDPQIRQVYMRHIQLAEYYPAAPRERRRSPIVHPAVTVSD